MQPSTPRSRVLSGSSTPGRAHSSSSLSGRRRVATEDGRVKVTLRVRPQNPSEREARKESVLEVEPTANAVTVRKEYDTFNFVFDSVLDPSTPQHELFDRVATPIIDDVMVGYNGTIMAYGQTGTGKTHTILGSADDDGTISYDGIIPQAVQYIFYKARNDNEHDYAVKMGYIQIYMEMIQDLLTPESSNLQIRESTEHGIYVENMTTVNIRGADDCMQHMQAGDRNRKFAFTNLNSHSSRSHAVLILIIERREKGFVDSEGRRKLQRGKLVIVDLAGSERIKKSGVEGVRKDEAKAINVSLSSLGNCIHALSDPKATHVPFRDSKLTRLLEDSLGGNAKTALVITAGPTEAMVSETMSTLQFGQRAMRVKVRAHINEEMDFKSLSETLQARLDTKDDAIHGLEVENDNLRSTIEIMKANGALPGGMGMPVAELEERVRELQQELEREMHTHGNTRAELAAMKQRYRDLEAKSRDMEAMKESREEDGEKMVKILRQQIQKLTREKSDLSFDLDEARAEVVRTRREFEEKILSQSTTLDMMKNSSDKLRAALKDAEEKAASQEKSMHENRGKSLEASIRITELTEAIEEIKKEKEAVEVVLQDMKETSSADTKRLLNQVTELEAASVRIACDRDTSKTECDRLSSEVSRLSEQLLEERNKAARIPDLLSERDSIKARLTDIEDANVSLMVERDALRADLETQKLAIEQSSREVQDIKDSVNILQSENKELERKLAEEKSSCEDQTAKKKDIEQELGESRQELDVTKTELEAIRQQLSNLSEKYNDNMAELKSVNKSALEYRTTVEQRMEEDAQLLEMREAQLRSGQESALLAQKELEAKVAEQGKDLDEAKAMINSLETDVARRMSELESSENTVQSMEEKLKSEAELHKKEIEQLVADNRELLSVGDESREENKRLLQTVADLEADLVTLDKEGKNREAELITEAAGLQALNEELSKRVSSLEEKVATGGEELARQRAAGNSALKELEQSAEAVACLNEEIGGLQKRLEAEKESGDATARAHQAEKESMEHKIRDLDQRCEILQREKKAVEEVGADRTAEMQLSIRKHEESIRDLERLLHEKEKECDGLKEDMGGLTMELESMTGRNVAESARIAKVNGLLNEHCIAQRSEIAMFRQYVEAEVSEIEEFQSKAGLCLRQLTDALRSAEFRLEATKEQLETTRGHLAEVSQDKESSLATVWQQLDLRERRVAELEEELQEQREDNRRKSIRIDETVQELNQKVGESLEKEKSLQAQLEEMVCAADRTEEVSSERLLEVERLNQTLHATSEELTASQGENEALQKSLDDLLNQCSALKCERDELKTSVESLEELVKAMGLASEAASARVSEKNHMMMLRTERIRNHLHEVRQDSKQAVLPLGETLRTLEGDLTLLGRAMDQINQNEKSMYDEMQRKQRELERAQEAVENSEEEKKATIIKASQQHDEAMQRRDVLATMLENEREEFSIRVDKMTSETKTLQSENENLKKENAALKVDIHDLSARMAEEISETRQQFDEHQSLAKSEVATMNDMYLGAQTRIEDLTKENKLTRQKLFNMRQRFNESIMELKTKFSQSLDGFRGELASMKEQSAQAMGEVLADVSKLDPVVVSAMSQCLFEAGESRLEVTAHLKQISVLEDEKEMQTRITEELKASLERAHTCMQDNSVQITALETENRNLSESCSDLKTNIAQCDLQVTETELMNSELESSLAAAREMIQQLESAKAQADAALEEEEASDRLQLEGLRGDLLEAQEEVLDKIKLIDEMTVSLTEYEERAVAAEKENESLRQEFDGFKENEHSNTVSALDEAKQELEGVKERLQELTKELESTNSRATKAEAEVSRLSNLVSDLESSSDRLHTSVENVNKARDMFISQLELKDKELQDLYNDLKSLRVNAAAKEEELVGDLANSRYRIVELEEELKGTQADLEGKVKERTLEMEATKGKLLLKEEEYTRMLEETSRTVHTAEDTKVDLEKRLQNAVNQRDDLKARNASLAAISDEKTDRIVRLEEKVHCSNAELQSLMEKFHAAKEQAASAEDSLENIQEEHAQLVSELKDQIASLEEDREQSSKNHEVQKNELECRIRELEKAAHEKDRQWGFQETELKEACRTATDEARKGRLELDQLLERTEMAEEKSSAALKELALTRRKLEQAQKLIDEKGCEMSQATKAGELAVVKVELELEEYKEKYSTTADALIQAADDNETLRSDKEELERKLEEVSQRFHEYRSAAGEKELSLLSRLETVQDTDATISRLESEKIGLEERLEEIGPLRASLETCKSHADKLQKELIMKSTMYEELQTDYLQLKENSVSNLGDTGNALVEQVADMESALAQERLKIDALRQQHRDAEATSAKKQENLLSRLADVETDRDGLVSTKLSLEKELSSARADIQQLSARLSELEQKATVYKAREGSSSELAAKLNANLSELQDSFKAKSEENAKLCERLSAAEGKLHRTCDDLEQTRLEMDDLSKIIDTEGELIDGVCVRLLSGAQSMRSVVEEMGLSDSFTTNLSKSALCTSVDFSSIAVDGEHASHDVVNGLQESLQRLNEQVVVSEAFVRTLVDRSSERKAMNNEKLIALKAAMTGEITGLQRDLEIERSHVTSLRRRLEALGGNPDKMASEEGDKQSTDLSVIISELEEELADAKGERTTLIAEVNRLTAEVDRMRVESAEEQHLPRSDVKPAPDMRLQGSVLKELTERANFWQEEYNKAQSQLQEAAAKTDKQDVNDGDKVAASTYDRVVKRVLELEQEKERLSNTVQQLRLLITSTSKQDQRSHADKKK